MAHIPMMVETCRECEGSGCIHDDPPHIRAIAGEVDPCCPRCGGKPRLKPLQGDVVGWSTEQVQGMDARGWFCPDPDTVMRWCLTHGGIPMVGSEDFCWIGADLSMGGCEDVVWVQPLALEVVEEG